MELEARNGDLPHTHSGASRLRRREDSIRGHPDRHGKHPAQHTRLKRDISELEGPSQCSLTDNTRSEGEEVSDADALYVDDDREPEGEEGTTPSPTESKPSTALGVAITPFFIATIATTAFQSPTASTAASHSSTGKHKQQQRGFGVSSALSPATIEPPFSERTQSMSTSTNRAAVAGTGAKAEEPTGSSRVGLSQCKSLPPVASAAEDNHNHNAGSNSTFRRTKQQATEAQLSDDTEQQLQQQQIRTSESMNLTAAAKGAAAANPSANATANTTPVDSGHYSSSYEASSAAARHPPVVAPVPTHAPLVETRSETSPCGSRQGLTMRPKENRNYKRYTSTNSTSNPRDTVVSVISVDADESTVGSNCVGRVEASMSMGAIAKRALSDGDGEQGDGDADLVGAVASAGRNASAISHMNMLGVGVGQSVPRTLSLSRRQGTSGGRVGRTTTTSTNAARHVHRRERKVTKTLTIVLFLFLFCWVPFFILNGISSPLLSVTFSI